MKKAKTMMKKAYEKGGTDAKTNQQPLAPIDQTIRRFLDTIQSEKYAANLNRAERKESLFHYTDLAGFKGLVSARDLWLTNSRFSNDDSEILHGYDVARVVVKAKIAEGPQDKFLEAVLKRLTPEHPEGVYICCFCDKDNLLSQWRGYGANGTGVSVEIDPRELSWATGPDMPLSIGLMRLWKVYYDEEAQQNKMVENAIKFGREELPKQHPNIDDVQRANMTADVIEYFIPTFKNQDFKGESEWRLIFTPAPNCKISPEFRVARQMLIPYYSLRKLLDAAREDKEKDKKKQRNGPNNGKLSKLPIRRVLLGPNYMSALNVEGAKMLLRASGYEVKEPADAVREPGNEWVTVEASKTPYRGS